MKRAQPRLLPRSATRLLAAALAAGAASLLAPGPRDLAGAPSAEAREPKKGPSKKKKAKAKKKTAKVEKRKTTKAAEPAFAGCRLQRPQKFLERRAFVKKGNLDPKKHARALRYLSERYGHIDTESTTRWNTESARKFATTVRFMGLPVSVHEKVAPALRCVEARIKKVCKSKDSRYAPRAVGGFRGANTFRGAEVSNHLFGIAVDIDPDKNPCCGCVEPWRSHPLCSEAVKSPYERAALTKCWVRAFARYGFDWLGHDELEDTMHFEFLGNPDRIKG